MDDFCRRTRNAFRSMHGLTADPEPRQTLNPSDAESGLKRARRHRVAGLWTAGLARPEPGPSPAPAWEKIAYGQTLHAARLTAEAGRIFAAIQSTVPDLRMVKGPAMAFQAWPQPGARAFDDLDFRCGKLHFDALQDGLRALGYRPEPNDAGRLNSLWHYGWGVTFRHPAGFTAEFNHRMFPPQFPWPERLTRLDSERWEKTELDGTPVVCPVPALHLLIACAHAVWHGWDRLAWMADIAGLMVRYPALGEQAERWVPDDGFVRRAWHCCAGTADRIFGPLGAVAAGGKTEQDLSAQAFDLLTGAAPPVSAKGLRRIHRQLMSPCESALYSVRRVFTPGDSDFKTVSFGRPFRSLYWLFRPFRAVGRGLQGRGAAGLRACTGRQPGSECCGMPRGALRRGPCRRPENGAGRKTGSLKSKSNIEQGE